MYVVTQALANLGLIAVCGLGAGILGGGLLGLGGAVILTPLLTILLNLPIQYSAGISLVSAISTSIMAGSRFLRMGLPNTKVFIALSSAGTTGAIMGSLMAYHIINSGYNWILYLVFSGVMYMAMALVARPKQHVVTALPVDVRDSYVVTGSYLDQALKVYVNYGIRRSNLLKAWGGVMLFGGVISGLLGIGGGPINMLALYWAAEMPIKVASATSNLIVGATAATSGTLYWFFGYIQPFMAMASVIGIVIGANISTHILPKARGGSTIKILLLSIFSYLAYRMLLSGLKRGGGIFVLPTGIEYVTSFMVLIITLGILFALRKYIND
ncbi:sulfite exporter TauE/SafE family protein [Vulcanisaeta souniana]|uniref:sulfite exporter TauE/SafE family protein n=1 Tax=Vulcanisaeta souniana TaxID=164452 RepID=UPI0006D10A3D|nr:sulfite exporter TauE/SafE family protein [Vulcanisaeta souniana]